MPPSASLASSRSATPLSNATIGGRQQRDCRRLCLRTRAEGGSDLDEQWRQFKRSAGIKIPVTERVAEPPRFSGTRSGEWNSGPSADQMRRQEQQVLNAWTQERLMQLAAGGTMVLVLVLLFAAGGPPSDARCTLPWC
ncbi:hypothetical protein ABPG77_005423 [Micractinium sp. CCAP 211/92]